jgi:arylsulfatase A-like enzyme
MPAYTLSRRSFLGYSGAAIAASLGLSGYAAHGLRQRPNIVFFLVDDMGWKDSSVYGSLYHETPGMDRMAREGIRFTQAYAAAVCSPTRAAILTGQYPERLGLITAVGHLAEELEPALPESGPPHARVISPQSKSYLPLEHYTVAEALRDEGYATCHIGKLHVGGKEDYWASNQGFETVFGGTGAPGPTGYFSPYFLHNVVEGPDGEYITDRVTDEAITFMEAHQKVPFLLNVWHYAVHGPWQAPEDLIGKYQDRMDPDAPQHNPVYAAMLDSMDQSLGRILDALDELGIADNTVVVFMSDNGGMLYTETWDAHSPPYTHITSNAPLRGGKGTIWEGGIRVPMMVRWPGVVEPGSVCSEVVHCVDFYPTFLDIAGTEPQPQHRLDGETLVPLLKGTGTLQREAVYGHFPYYTWPDHTKVDVFANTPASYVRKGDWKLVRLYGVGPHLGPKDELYNLADDIGESHDRAAQRPGIAAALADMLDRHLEEAGAIVPQLNPAYVPPENEWRAVSACKLELREDYMHIESTGMSAQIESPTFSLPGPAKMVIRARCPEGNDTRWQSFGGRPRVYWSGRGGGQPSSYQVFDVPRTGQWHEIEAPLPTESVLGHIRLQIGYPPAVMDVQWVHLVYTGRYYENMDTAVMWDFRQGVSGPASRS